VIVECNGRTLPQERYNAEWVTEKHMGIVLNSFRQINSGVEQLLEPSAFASFSAQARTYNNRALFEIPEFLEEILEYNSRAIEPASPVGSKTTLEPKSPLTPRLEASYAK
jgi:1,2-diacylglycerol 3-beta-galactosyltransferase